VVEVVDGKLVLDKQVDQVVVEELIHHQVAVLDLEHHTQALLMQ
tara:strand:+ start:719 stop:850 length:132 start_codon:yes stop_codon:yes gene_type:complete